MMSSFFFLRHCGKPEERRENKDCVWWCWQTYLIPQPHDTTWRGDRDETAGDKTLNTSLLCGLGEGDLILLLCGTDTADDNVDTGEGIGQGLFGALEVAFTDLNTTVLQGEDGRFLNRSGTHEGVQFLRGVQLVRGQVKQIERRSKRIRERGRQR